MQPTIEPPTNVSSVPDEATKTGPDYTGANASKRVLYVNLGFVKYGTNDKVHAAALILSFVLLLAVFAVIGQGFYQGEHGWADKVFSWLGSAFLFVAGVAVGKGTTKEKEDGED